MSRRFVLTLSVFLFTASFSLGQCDFIRADRFDNIWVIHNSEVICFDKQQKKIGSYSNILLGKPSTIDVLDPFRVVVFYPSTQTLVILNNAVAEIANSVNIRSKGVNEASLVCRSSKGGFWVFDRSTWQILHFDSGFNSTGEKFNPDMQLSGSKPVFMQEYKGVLYVAFEGKAICRQVVVSIGIASARAARHSRSGSPASRTRSTPAIGGEARTHSAKAITAKNSTITPVSANSVSSLPLSITRSKTCSM